MVSRCIQEQFTYQANRYPQNIAVQEGQRQITYGDLNRRANQFAHYLIDRGTQPGQIVGVHLKKSVELIVALLGVLKAGAAYLPLDPAYPSGRLQAIIDDAQLDMIIARGDLMPGSRAISVIDYCDFEADSCNYKDLTPSVSCSGDSLFYVIYTSGSTGSPKGVMVSHANVMRLFPAMSEFRFGSEDVWSLFHSYSFGFSVWEIWGALLSGAKLVIIPEQAVQTPSRFIEEILKNRVTIASLTPSVFHQLLKTEKVEKLNNGILRLFFLSGEAVNLRDLERWVNTFTRKPRLISTYAITETGGQVFYRSFGRKDLASVEAALSHHLGTLLDDTEVYVVDENANRVSSGQTGELWVSGPGIASGYLNQPRLTAERFIANRFGGDYPIYKTGDRVRWESDNNIEFVGRDDHQIKLRGYRVELQEIEKVVNDHPDVEGAVVVANSHQGFYTSLSAHLVLDKSEPVANESDVEIWPSLGEYNVYDDMLYDFMTNEVQANAQFLQLIDNEVRGKVVVDVGTGKDAVFAELCCQAGAEKVYAIELLPKVAAQAKLRVERLGLSSQVEVIAGDACEIELDIEADILISRVVGNIGSSDGVVAILNSARRFLKPSGKIIPGICVTKIAAVSLPESTRNRPVFADLARPYLDDIYQQVGFKFDVKLCLRNIRPENIISDVHTFEVLDFSQYFELDYRRQAEFSITREARFDGFLLWLVLSDDQIDHSDYFDNQNAWLPVFLPIDSAVAVAPGDRIAANWSAVTAGRGINPDYGIQGTVKSAGAEKAVPFHLYAPHKAPVYCQNHFYQKLFENTDATFSIAGLKRYLRNRLPNYMVPNQFGYLQDIPLSVNGKVDYGALPKLQLTRPPELGRTTAPRNLLEKALLSIWQSLLPYSDIGVEDNFFDLGGTSLLAMQISVDLQMQWHEGIHVTSLYEAPTVAEFARFLAEHYSGEVQTRYGAETLAYYLSPKQALEIDMLSRQIIDDVRQYLLPLTPPSTYWQKSDAAVFILSSPGSGSDVLGSMLAINPACVVTGEWAPDSSEQAFNTGVQALPGNKLFVRTSTRYAITPSVLEQAERHFKDVKYIHLVRHPCGAIQSCLDNKISCYFEHPQALSRRALAELHWLISNQNILNFLASVPGSRKMALGYEQLVEQPDAMLNAVSRFLGVAYVSGPETRVPVNLDTANSWQSTQNETNLYDDSKMLMSTLGYLSANQAVDRFVNRRHYLGSNTLAQRDWFNRLNAETAGPCVIFIHGADGADYYYQSVVQFLRQREAYSLSAPIENGQFLRFDSLEEQAGYYARRIVSELPDKSFVISGVSLGGVIGVEVARQLSAAGKRVHFCLLLDSRMDLQLHRLSTRIAEKLMRTYYLVLRVLKQKNYRIKLKNKLKVLANTLLARQKFNIAPTAPKTELVFIGEDTQDYFRYQIRLERQFAQRPKPYPGDIRLLRGGHRTERPMQCFDDYGLGRFYQNKMLKVRFCQGSHLGFVQQNCRDIANYIDAQLDEATPLK